MINVRIRTIFTLLVLVTAPGRFVRGQSTRPDPSNHTVTFVQVERGVRLEILDWGGSGPSLVLLAGLNNTAHVFDEFALRWTSAFHVRGITRRGFGASSRPADGYNIGTLAADVWSVLQQLSITQTVLVGHSLAGDELTKLAATHAGAVQALVYVDAAYDRTNEPQALPTPDQPVTAEDLASLSTLQARWQRVFGWRLPEDEARATVVFDNQNRPLRSALSTDVASKILKGVERPAYRQVRSPVLALYAIDDVTSTYPNFNAFNGENKQRATRQVSALRRWQESSIAQFTREVANGRVVRFDAANHYLFLTDESKVVRSMQAFLDAMGTDGRSAKPLQK